MAPNKPQNSAVEVITDFKAIKDEIGLNVEENSLYLALSLDACKDVSPTLVKTPDGKYYLIVKEIERGTFAGNGRAAAAVTSHQINMVYYGSYFTWEAIQKAVAPGAPTPAKALARVISVDAVTVNGDMPLDKYRGFKDQFRVTLKPDGKEAAKAFVYEVDKKEVTATYNKGRALAEKAAIELINNATVSNADKALIKENIASYQADTFPVLDKLMGQCKLPILLASSRINVQELTTLPWRLLKDNVLALYNGKQVFVISRKPLQNPLLKKPREFKNLRAALDSLIGDASLGVEEKDLNIGRVLEIGLDKVKNATDIFRAWREQTAHRDLPYYVISGHATRYAMENALAVIEKGIAAKKKLTEKDCEKEFLAQLNSFRLKYCPFTEMVRYFVVLHAGTRTYYASLSSDFPLDASINSLKLDAGALLFQDDILRACSDMCRSLVYTEPGKAVYQLTEKCMLEAAIPAAKPGNTGADVYWAGVTPLVNMEAKIREWGMLPPGVSIKESYNRDIGHIVAKQEPVTLGFTKEQTSQKLQPGMIGCVEYQWPYQKHALGVEDEYLVTDKRGIVISR